MLTSTSVLVPEDHTLDQWQEVAVKAEKSAALLLRTISAEPGRSLTNWFNEAPKDCRSTISIPVVPLTLELRPVTLELDLIDRMAPSCE